MKAYLKMVLLVLVVFISYINCGFANKAQLNDTYGAYGLYKDEVDFIQFVGKKFMITKPEYDKSQDHLVSQFYSLDETGVPHKINACIIYYANDTGYINELRVFTTDINPSSQGYDAFFLSVSCLGNRLLTKTQEERKRLSEDMDIVMATGSTVFWSSSNQRACCISYMKRLNGSSPFMCMIYKVPK